MSKARDAGEIACLSVLSHFLYGEVKSVCVGLHPKKSVVESLYACVFFFGNGKLRAMCGAGSETPNGHAGFWACAHTIPVYHRIPKTANRIPTV